MENKAQMSNQGHKGGGSGGHKILINLSERSPWAVKYVEDRIKKYYF